MKHNSDPANRKSSRLPVKLFMGLLALGLTASLAGSPKATGQETPHKGGGDGKQTEAPYEYKWAPDPVREAKAAWSVADGLTRSFEPVEPGAQMGSSGPNEIIIFGGTLTATKTATGEKIEVNNPIVSSTERPADQLATGWIITQSKDEHGNIQFNPVNLAEYDWVVTNPVDQQNPYVLTYGTHQPVKGGPTPESEQYRMFECDATGTIPNAEALSALGWVTYTPPMAQ